MDRVIPILLVAAFVVAWNVFFYKESGGRTWSWLWTAFGTTSGSILHLVAGTIGYTLDRHDRFVAHTPWAGHVIWSQIGIGLALALLAAYCWRKGLQRIRQQPRGSLRHA
jgi:membrane protein implicated in regulation of membrane protease activity